MTANHFEVIICCCWPDGCSVRSTVLRKSVAPQLGRIEMMALLQILSRDKVV